VYVCELVFTYASTYVHTYMKMHVCGLLHYSANQYAEEPNTGR
jgi:hypothetical protein